MVRDDQPSPDRSLDRSVTHSVKTYSVKELYDQEKRGDLIVQPEFQRRSVWDQRKKSRLIESALMDVPLPIVYLAQNEDGTLEVVDGQQRLRAFFEYMDNSYDLKKLDSDIYANNKWFRDLAKDDQDAVCNTPITVVILTSSDSNMKFDIFERLNTGAVPLNEQELRNCIFRGKYNELLYELNKDRRFRKLYGVDLDKRMKDVEVVLRLFAFYHTHFQDYQPPMKRFLNREMETWQKAITDDECGKLRGFFGNSLELAYTVFGQNAFRRFFPGKSGDENGKWSPTFNKALFEIVMYAFKGYEKAQIVPRVDCIHEGLIHLMTGDEQFLLAITEDTDKKDQVNERFGKWRSELREIVGTPQKEPRCFSRLLKKQLFDTNQVCAICRNFIKEIDDAAVDHLVQYWRGGRTIPENARLTHRYCNSARRPNDQPIGGLQNPPGDGQNCVEIRLTRGNAQYKLIPMRSEYRDRFPGYEVRFAVETDIGSLTAYVTGAREGAEVGDPGKGRMVKGVTKWFEAHPELGEGSRLVVQVIEPNRRYRLSVRS